MDAALLNGSILSKFFLCEFDKGCAVVTRRLGYGEFLRRCILLLNPKSLEVSDIVPLYGTSFTKKAGNLRRGKVENRQAFCPGATTIVAPKSVEDHERADEGDLLG